MAKRKTTRGDAGIELTKELFDRILEIPIGEDGCPITISALSAEEAGTTRIVRNAVRLLDALHEHPQKLTEKSRQLNRRFVRTMLGTLELDEEIVTTRRGWSVVDEAQVWPLAMLRDLVQVGRLGRVYHGQFLATKRGDELRAPERAGELHHALLMAYLQRYNIAAIDRFSDDPMMGDFFGAALLRLGTLLRTPLPLSDFADRMPHDEDVWEVPGLLYEFRIDPAWELHAALTRRILEPLAEFGLLTSIMGDTGDDKRLAALREDSERKWQVTPLFDRVVALETGGGRASLAKVITPSPSSILELVPEPKRMSVGESLDAYARSVAGGDPKIAASVRQRLMLFEAMSGMPFMTTAVGSKTAIEAAITQLPTLLRSAAKNPGKLNDRAEGMAVLALIFAGYVTWCVTNGQARYEVAARALAALEPWLPAELADEWPMH